MVQSSSLESRFLLDSETLIDGRVINLFRIGLLSGRIFIPRISYELARESSKGRSAMAQLQQLKCGLSIQPSPNGISEVDEIVRAAKELGARLITVSELIGDRAEKLGLPVINLKELLRSLLPRADPGDVVRVRIVKRGKGSGEGVGYLEFGVKVVVDRAGDKVGKEVAAVVKNALTTPSGMVLFTELV